MPYHPNGTMQDILQGGWCQVSWGAYRPLMSQVSTWFGHVLCPRLFLPEQLQRSVLTYVQANKRTSCGPSSIRENLKVATSIPNCLTWENLSVDDLFKADAYNGIDNSTGVCHFLADTNKPPLKTAVKICVSQVLNQTDFVACASYLIFMVQKSHAAKKVNITSGITQE